MSYTYHGTSELIALPNRTVQTYPSGLVRVERSFVCRKADAAKFRKQIIRGEKMPQDTGDVAVDDLFIFPDPSEVARDDGFSEFRVTAYGRTNKTGQRFSQLPITRFVAFTASYQQYNQFYDPADESVPLTITTPLASSIAVDVISPTYNLCVPSNEIFTQPDDINELGRAFISGTQTDFFSQSFSAAEIFPILDANVSPSSSVKINSTSGFIITNFQRVNFGKFDEIFVSYGVRLSSINFGSFVNKSSPPTSQKVTEVAPTYGGALLQLIKIPNATGVRVTINGVTVSAPYGGAASSSLFGIGMGAASGDFLGLTINGLEQGTVYTATIVTFNENGSSSTTTVSFRTLSFIDTAL